MTTDRLNQRSAVTAIANRKEFVASALSGGGKRFTIPGQLPRRYHEVFESCSIARDFYAVWSYATPIAWFAHGFWYIPDVTYSPTTSKHQGKLYQCNPRIRKDGFCN